MAAKFAPHRKRNPRATRNDGCGQYATHVHVYLIQGISLVSKTSTCMKRCLSSFSDDDQSDAEQREKDAEVDTSINQLTQSYRSALRNSST